MSTHVELPARLGATYFLSFRTDLTLIPASLAAISDSELVEYFKQALESGDAENLVALLQQPGYTVSPLGGLSEEFIFRFSHLIQRRDVPVRAQMLALTETLGRAAIRADQSHRLPRFGLKWPWSPAPKDTNDAELVAYCEGYRTSLEFWYAALPAPFGDVVVGPISETIYRLRVFLNLYGLTDYISIYGGLLRTVLAGSIELYPDLVYRDEFNALTAAALTDPNASNEERDIFHRHLVP